MKPLIIAFAVSALIALVEGKIIDTQMGRITRLQDEITLVETQKGLSDSELTKAKGELSRRNAEIEKLSKDVADKAVAADKAIAKAEVRAESQKQELRQTDLTPIEELDAIDNIFKEFLQ
jgi:hypothetical protein